MDFVPPFCIMVFGKESFVSRQKKEFEEYEINESYKTEARDNPYGFKRKSKEERPVLAICYDFDKTLSPDDMQAQGYIQSVNYHVDRFWAESNEMARANGMDSNLAYMYKMVREAKGHFDLSRKALEEYGSKVELFPGVDEWFERVRQYGDKNGVIIEHYIISSGLKEMIEGTEIAKRGSFEEMTIFRQTRCECHLEILSILVTAIQIFRA